MSEVEETIKRISGHKGVIGLIVVNLEGIPIRTTLDNSTTVQYACKCNYVLLIRHIKKYLDLHALTCILTALTVVGER